MTSSVPDAPPASRRGEQRPRICSVPPTALSSAGQEAVELAASAGLKLDPWQAFVLDQSLGERTDGKWSAFEVGLIVARQNGKGTILEARELAGLFLFGEELILHSAHEFKTAADAFRRISTLITDYPQFKRHVRRIRTANGSEMIELKSGQRLRFVARSAGSGRGFAADVVILDEAYELGDAAMAALLPTLSARPNPQIWYTSTAGGENSVQLARVRRRGVAGGDPSLAFFEWSAEETDDPDDPQTWARANPGLGIRISEDYLWRERSALSPEGFAMERLSIGRYPVDGADAWRVIPKEAWLSLLDARSEPQAPVAFAVAVEGRREWASIALAGRRSDGLLHVEAVDHHEGTSWVVPRVQELWAKHSPCAIVIDKAGHEGSFLTELQAAGIEVLCPSAQQVAAGFGQFYDAAVNSGNLRHRGDPPLMAALGAAETRDVSEGRTWARKGSAADISPLVAATLALWGFGERGPSGDVGVWVI